MTAVLPPLVALPVQCELKTVQTFSCLRLIVYMIAVYSDLITDVDVYERLNRAVDHRNIFLIRDILQASLGEFYLANIVTSVVSTLLRGVKGCTFYMRNNDIADQDYFLESSRKMMWKKSCMQNFIVVKSKPAMFELLTTNKTINTIVVNAYCFIDDCSGIRYEKLLFLNMLCPNQPFMWCIPKQLILEARDAKMSMSATGSFLNFLSGTAAILRAPTHGNLKALASLCCGKTSHHHHNNNNEFHIHFEILLQSFLYHWLYINTELIGTLQMFSTLWHSKIRTIYNLASLEKLNVSRRFFSAALHSTHVIKALIRQKSGQVLYGVPNEEYKLCGLHAQPYDVGTVSCESDIPLHSVYTTNNHAPECTTCEEIWANYKKNKFIYIKMESKLIMVYVLSYAWYIFPKDLPIKRGSDVLYRWETLNDDLQITREKDLERFEKTHYITYEKNSSCQVKASSDETLASSLVSYRASLVRSNAVISNKVTNVLAFKEGFSHSHCHMRKFIRSRWRSRHPTATFTNFVRGNPRASICTFNINFNGDTQTLRQVLRTFSTFITTCTSQPLRYLLPISINNANSTIYIYGVENVTVLYNKLAKRQGHKLARFPAVEVMVRINAKTHKLKLRLSPKNICPRDPNTAIFAAYVHGRLSVNLQRNFAPTLFHTQAEIWKLLVENGIVIDTTKNFVFAMLEKNKCSHVPKKVRIFLECLIEVCRLYMTPRQVRLLCIKLVKRLTWNV